MMSLDPFIRISERNYVRLSAFKRETMSESMDDVIDVLLKMRFESIAGTQFIDSNNPMSRIQNPTISS